MQAEAERGQMTNELSGGWHSSRVVAAAFVISDQASYITGQVWWVNGGAVMG